MKSIKIEIPESAMIWDLSEEGMLTAGLGLTKEKITEEQLKKAEFVSFDPTYYMGSGLSAHGEIFVGTLEEFEEARQHCFPEVFPEITNEGSAREWELTEATVADWLKYPKLSDSD